MIIAKKSERKNKQKKKNTRLTIAYNRPSAKAAQTSNCNKKFFPDSSTGHGPQVEKLFA